MFFLPVKVNTSIYSVSFKYSPPISSLHLPSDTSTTRFFHRINDLFCMSYHIISGSHTGIYAFKQLHYFHCSPRVQISRRLIHKIRGLRVIHPKLLQELLCLFTARKAFFREHLAFMAQPPPDLKPGLAFLFSFCRTDVLHRKFHIFVLRSTVLKKSESWKHNTPFSSQIRNFLMCYCRYVLSVQIHMTGEVTFSSRMISFVIVVFPRAACSNFSETQTAVSIFRFTPSKASVPLSYSFYSASTNSIIAKILLMFTFRLLKLKAG